MSSNVLAQPIQSKSRRNELRRSRVVEKKLRATHKAQQVATGWRRIAYLAAACGFFVLGVAGAILPGLPATPFLLLTSYFLIRSSPRLNQKLLDSRLLGPILVDWQVNGGVRPHVKVKAIAVVMLTVALSVYVSGYSTIFASVVCALAALGITVIWRLPIARDSSHERHE